MSPSRHYSLRYQLPAGFATIVLVVVAGFTWIAWRGVRAAALEAWDERLGQAETALANVFGPAARQVTAQAESLAVHPAVVALLRSGSEASQVGAVVSERRSSQILAVEVLDTTGQRVFADLRHPVPERGRVPDLGSAGLSGFVAFDTLVVYTVSMPVQFENDLVGWVLVWRGAGSNPATIRLIRDLIGPNAFFLVGVPGEGWSDFVTVVPGPPAGLPEGETIEAAVAGRGDRVGQGRRLAGTRWWIWVGFPREYVFGVSRSFLNVVVPVSLVLVGAGALAGWRVSRRLTEPLGRLAEAADGIAGGDVQRRVAEPAARELAVLARAFNHMADEVEAGMTRLEERVAARTRELHEAQDALVRKERLAILGQLSSGVGHELRNPLGVMNNAVYVLRAMLKDQPAKVGEYLDILGHQITLSERIVGDLLDFARIKEPQRVRVAARDLVEGPLARATVPQGVVVTRDYPTEPVPVLVDPVQIGQVTLNLIVNAIQAMDGNGTLRLGVRRDGPAVRLTVTDTGPGIAAENRDRIFEPLFTTRARGIGLGLAVSRSLAEANGGRLTLDATGPTGTTFALNVPLIADVA